MGLIESDDGEDAVPQAATSQWRAERDRRQAGVDAYLTANAADFKSFKNTPLGNTGIPMIMFRLFPEMFPTVWGKPSDNFAAIGLAKDTFEPTRVLPLGLGFTGSQPAISTPAGPVNVNVVNLTCAGCHDGRVVGPDGNIKHIVGGPSTTFTSFRVALFRTVNSPGYTADAFRAALSAKPIGFIYGDPTLAQQEALERAIFLAPGAAEAFLDKLKTGVNASAARTQATLGTFTYNVPNAPNLSGATPGFLDALGVGVSVLVDPATMTAEQMEAILPPAPAMIDIMSVWRQGDRPAAQWDGSIVNLLHRNLGAEFGVVGDPTAVDLNNAFVTARFTNQLPAPPYPFDVDTAAAARGKDLFVEYCASCHAPGNRNLFPPEVVGTDENRAIVLTPGGLAGLVQALRIACSDASICNGPDGKPLADDDIVKATFAYSAVPLDGIWARAPYLHNGSVPTLSALLTGNRPAKFCRGNLTYDQTNVGWSYTTCGPGAATFDTSLAGMSNTGHLSQEFNGDVDWKNSPQELADLLAYLKTL